MTCRHCHKPIGRTASWQQIYFGGHFVDLCSLAVGVRTVAGMGRMTRRDADPHASWSALTREETR